MDTVVENRIGSVYADAYLSKISYVIRDINMDNEFNYLQTQYTFESNGQAINGKAHGHLDSSNYA